MRHEVRRAKVHTINKLVRESKKLKMKNGSEEQKQKYQKKAEKFMEEILTMKKLKDDEISKYALSHTRMSSEILSDPSSSVKEKALARLSSHSSISTRVNNFHTKFPTWTHTISQLLLQLGDKRKKKQTKKCKMQNDVHQKVLQTSRKSEIDHQENSIIEYLSDGDQTGVAVTSPEVDNSKEESSSVSMKNSNRVCEKFIRNTDLKLDNDVDSICETKIAKKSLAEIKRFTEHLKRENNTENENLDDGDSECAAETTIDPFFVHEDGETEYLTSVKVVACANEEINARKKEEILKQSIWNKSADRRSNRTDRRRNMFEQKSRSLSFKNVQTKSTMYDKISSNRNKQSPILMQKQKKVFNEELILTKGNDGPVHPSWEAKKKIKDQQRVDFALQGKKIKFDD